MHRIVAPPGISQLTFERLMDAARIAHGGAEFEPAAALREQFEQAKARLIAARAAYHRLEAQRQALSREGRLAYLDLALLWAECATLALTYHFQIVRETGKSPHVTRLTPWREAQTLPQGLLSILDGCDLAILLAERRARGFSADLDADRRFAAKFLRSFTVQGLFEEESEEL